MLYLLVVHGSRDSRYPIALENLANNLRQSIGKSSILATATLECNQISLSEQLINFVLENQAIESKKITILPLFLISGYHVRQDIPQEINLAKKRLNSEWEIILKPHLGHYLNIQNFLDQQFRKQPSQGRIILSHGSRLENSHKFLETMALNIQAVTAYWSVDPSLEFQVTNLVNLGYSSINIMPYFLFPGGITDAVTQKLADFIIRFPNVKFYQGKTLAETPEITQFIVKEML